MLRPHKYYLRSPANLVEREALVRNLTEELARWREPENAQFDHADTQWALQRLPIVLAIENYYLRKGSLPATMDDLSSAGLLSDPSLAKQFRLELKNGKWELRKTDAKDFLTAVGN